MKQRLTKKFEPLGQLFQ